MPERRGQDRAQNRGESLVASVTIGDVQYTGTVVDTSSAGVRVAFSNQAPPLFRIGEEVSLTFEGAQLDEQHRMSTVVRDRQDNAEHRHYGFTFQGSRAPAPEVKDAAFNRRLFLRFYAPRSVAVQLQVRDSNTSGAVLHGTVVDLSGGGVSVLLPEGAESRMRDATQVAVTLTFPGRSRPETRNGQIRNRTATEKGTRYGVLFIPCPTELPGPQYEPAWDCNRCGERGLLATSHLHCPNCGTSQGRTAPYFPDWASLAPSDTHRFFGRDVRCGGCGGLFSDKARHCGACGTHL
ncbi:MAG: hypothetical protein GWP91_02955 [Rhodobacterales bacterium]|nr:hypothetical protein [Rhodobacterales bacterium]